MVETGDVAAPSRGHRVRRAAARSAIVLGFAVSGWLAATGSASAEATPPPPPAPASLFGGLGSLLGSVSTPLTPAASQVTPAVDVLAGPVVSVLAAPVVDVLAGPVVSVVAGPVVDVLAPVMSHGVTTLVAPAAQILHPLLTPLAPGVRPLSCALGPLVSSVSSVSSTVASALGTDAPPESLQPLTTIVDGAAAQPVVVTGANAGPLAAPVAAGPTPLPHPAATGWGAINGDPAAGSPAADAVASPRPLVPAVTLTGAPTGAPTDGPPVPAGEAPSSPVGLPGPGSGMSSTSGVNQLLGTVEGPAALHRSTLVCLASSSDEATLLALAYEPGSFPD